jgi:uncharacterized tellurite resistance protein B-like protein
MPYGVRCPHCKTRQVEIAKKLWFLRGWVLMARYGTHTHLGCVPCVREKVRNATILNLLAGWWCFPWGIATPFVLIQNILAAFQRADDVLTDEALRSCGVNPNEVRLDAEGFSQEQRNMVDAAFALLSGTIRADGIQDIREFDVAVAILRTLTADRLTDAAIQQKLRTPGGKFNVRLLDFDQRISLVQMMLRVIAADGAVSPKELQYLRLIAGRLEIPPPNVELRTWNGSSRKPTADTARKRKTMSLQRRVASWACLATQRLLR